MTSSRAHQQWSFGRFTVIGDDLISDNLKTGGVFDNFSHPSFRAGMEFPLNQDPNFATPNISSLFEPISLLLPRASLSTSARQALAVKVNELEVIRDSRRIGQDGTSCFSCHMIDQALKRASENAGLTNKGKSALQNSEQDSIFLTFRQFGYELGFQVHISSRVIISTSDVVDVLRIAFPDKR